MSEPTTAQPAAQSDPFAEFGGTATGATPATSAVPAPASAQSTVQPVAQSDPFAEFGGVKVPTTAQRNIPPNNIYQAAPDEQTPEGSAAAIARRQAQYPTLTAVGQGAGEALGDVWDAAKGLPSGILRSLPPVQLHDSIKQAVPIIQAYENARSSGKGIWDSLTVANETAKQHDAAQQALQARIDEFKKKPGAASVRAVADAAAIAATIYDGGAVNPANTELPAGLSEANAATRANAAESTSPAITPRELQVQKAVAKAPVSEGTPAETPLTTADQTQKLQTEVQPTLQKGIQDVAQKAATDSGVTPAKTPARLRDTYHVQGNAMKASARADFQVLDEASGGRWQRFQDQIENVQRKMDEVSGIDDDDYSDLETKRNSIQTDQAQMIEDLKANGKVDPALADRANAMYRKAYANYDVGNAVRGATKRASVGGKPADVVDASGLSQRLQKLDDQPIGGGQSRLRQALGDEHAETLLGHADSAQGATQGIKDFIPNTATGKQALTELLQNNTGVGRLASMKQAIGLSPKIDYIGAYSDFNKMNPAQQVARFGAEVTQANTFLQSQARWQVGKMIVGGLTVEEIARRTGIASAVLQALIGS